MLWRGLKVLSLKHLVCLTHSTCSINRGYRVIIESNIPDEKGEAPFGSQLGPVLGPALLTTRLQGEHGLEDGREGHLDHVISEVYGNTGLKIRNIYFYPLF